MKKPRLPQGSRGSGELPRPLGAAGSVPAIPGQGDATTATVINTSHSSDASLEQCYDDSFSYRP
ncbi:uncharacterized protein METZ01_LOCUS313776 [marine metagenome]|uniref:Uncharacterized protein n=1 Tax=marine metagenome TaxID=408172 RepID=A0A382NMH9_9ZZZZ